MKVKVNQKLKLHDGVSPIKMEGNQDLTLGSVCINSILTPVQTDTVEQKLEKYDIFKKLRDGKAEVELSVEEIALLKKSIGTVNPPLIVGQAFEMIEGK
jgi:hypothetical protein